MDPITNYGEIIIIIILICQKVGLARPIQQKLKLPWPYLTIKVKSPNQVGEMLFEIVSFMKYFCLSSAKL